MITDITQ